jgi:hypothetical protein
MASTANEGGGGGGYKRKPKRSSSSGNSGTSYGGGNSGWKPGKNPTIKLKPRKNGVFQGWTGSGSKANEKEGKKKPPRTGRFSNAGHFGEGPMRDSGYGHKPGGKTPKGAKAAAERRTTQTKDIPTLYRERLDKNNPNNPNRYQAGMEGYRKHKRDAGQFKGKYYGPDEFKGNLKMVDEWRKHGSPTDRKAFAKKFAKTHLVNKSGPNAGHAH